MDDDKKSGQVLRVACEKRRRELEEVLDFIGMDVPGTRRDIEAALGALATMLTGDLDHIPPMTSDSLTKWLRSSRYLGLKEQRAIAAGRATPRPV